MRALLIPPIHSGQKTKRNKDPGEGEIDETKTQREVEMTLKLMVRLKVES